MEPHRIPRQDHPVSRKQFSPAALKVLYGLRDAGFEAYVVGGAVRDILSGVEPKDFDIATNAHPDQIRQVFRNCRLIGRRFMIAHVRYGHEIIEVTTFRGDITDSHQRDETGRILSDNQYGSLESDAFRRDFTANALYYDINDFSVVDYTGGADDVYNRVLRLIGDPELRYREDPVRMLRAVRIANKLGFSIDDASALPIPRLAPLLREIPPARLFDEVLKILMGPDAVANFTSLRAFGLFGHLFPQSEATLTRYPAMQGFVLRALENTSKRIAEDLPVTPAFLFAALLWPRVAERFMHLQTAEGHPLPVALAQSADETIAQACLHISIPKRYSMPMREIWDLQPRLEQTKGAKAKRLLAHPRFRAAYDFLLLRAETGDADPELAEWWTQAQVGVDLSELRDDEAEAEESPTSDDSSLKKRRRRGGRGRKPGGAPSANA